MEAGTLLPRWEDLVKHSCETATAKDSWLSAVSNVGVDKYQLSDPFAIVTDPTKRRKKEAPGGSKDNPAIQSPPISDSEGYRQRVISVESYHRESNPPISCSVQR